jgi:hypothetical protein
MANHKGSEGLIKVGTNTVAELRGWEMTETAEMIEDTELSDGAKTYQTGNTGWTGSASCWWDETDTNGQEAMTIGASITLKMYPEGATTGDIYYSGTALVNQISRRGAINGIVEADFAFTGSGTLARGTTP